MPKEEIESKNLLFLQQLQLVSPLALHINTKRNIYKSKRVWFIASLNLLNII